jgi:hypothetical protein
MRLSAIPGLIKVGVAVTFGAALAVTIALAASGGGSSSPPSSIAVATATPISEAQTPKASYSQPEIRLDEIRVGEFFVVDLLVRRDSEEIAHTWSNDPEIIGLEDFPPGKYKAVISIEAENLSETLTEILELVVPETIGEYVQVKKPEST